MCSYAHVHVNRARSAILRINLTALFVVTLNPAPQLTETLGHRQAQTTSTCTGSVAIKSLMNTIACEAGDHSCRSRQKDDGTCPTRIHDVYCDLYSEPDCWFGVGNACFGHILGTANTVHRTHPNILADLLQLRSLQRAKASGNIADIKLYMYPRRAPRKKQTHYYTFYSKLLARKQCTWF